MTSLREGEPTAGSGASAADPRWLADVAGAVRDSLSALERVLIGAEEGIALVGPDRRFAYIGPAACRLLGRPLEELRGQDFLASLLVSADQAAGGLPDQVGQPGVPFTCVARGADGAGREIVCSTFAVELAGDRHWVAIFRDLSGARAGARTALALAQTAARPVTGSTHEALAGIARHGVEGTRALTVGIAVMGDDHRLAAVGGYGYPKPGAAMATWAALSPSMEDVPGARDVLLTGRTIVLPDARTRLEADPRLADFAARLSGVDWQAAVYVPLSWEGRVFGVLLAQLPSGLDGPSEVELAVYTALADQAAVAVINARLTASLERARLARELHDSVSQALFSMTMYARAAQLAITQADLDPGGPLGRAVAQLADLTQGAMAEMRALIFELRPASLAEEGLVAALRTQAAALTAREGLPVAVDGPEERLELGAGTEEHLYRIALEALHNAVKHAAAGRADVRVTDRDGVLRVTVSDDGAGFDPGAGQAGHLGLSTMAGRARAIGAELTVTSAPGAGTTVTLVLPTASGPQRMT